MKQLNLKLSEIIKGKYYANVEITSSLVEIRVVHCYSRNNKHKNYLFIMASAFYVIFLLAAFNLINSTMRHIIIYAFILKIKYKYNTFNMFVLVLKYYIIVFRPTNYNLKCV